MLTPQDGKLGQPIPPLPSPPLAGKIPQLPTPSQPDPKSMLPAQAAAADAYDWEQLDNDDWALFEEFRDPSETNNGGAPSPSELADDN